MRVPKTSGASIGMVLALAVSGCELSHDAVARGYCDPSGCYQCDRHDSCWTVPVPPCTAEASCAEGASCTQLGCLSGCLGGGSCGDGTACVDGLCVPAGFERARPIAPAQRCSDDGGCAKEQYCGEAGRCVDRCRSDEQCGPGMVCQPWCGKCQPKGVPATCGSARVYCAGESSCGTGKTCVSGRCHFQCGLASEACPVGQTCQGGTCADDVAPRSPQCALDLHCGGGQCINGYCHASCTQRESCGARALCNLGVCQPDYHPASQ
ncbi:MAG: hypothetical protein IT371_26330 [Deltaproteobacteria bacterium]|nr:hypothetical protein [Deltaproteobacteria bacterium]